MPIIWKNGKALKENELDSVQNLIYHSINKHIDALENVKEEDKFKDSQALIAMINAYKNGLKNLDSTFQVYQNGDNDITVDRLITNIFEDISSVYKRKIKDDDPIHQRIDAHLNVNNVIKRGEDLEDFYNKPNVENVDEERIDDPENSRDSGSYQDYGENLDESYADNYITGNTNRNRSNSRLSGDEDSLSLDMAPKTGPEERKVPVNKETLKYLMAVGELSQQVRGFFNDSPEYLNFQRTLRDLTSLTRQLLKDSKTGVVTDDVDYGIFRNKVLELKASASIYEAYKLSNKTELKNDKSGKKMVNSDDKNKLDIIRNVMHAKCLDVDDSVMSNEQFYEEATRAKVRLENKHYIYKEDYLNDAAYVLFKSMHRANDGQLPRDPNTGYMLSLAELKNRKIESGELLESLTTDDKKLLSPKKILGISKDSEFMHQVARIYKKQNVKDSNLPKKVNFTKNPKKTVNKLEGQGPAMI